MTDNIGYGREKRRAGNVDILSGKTTFRDAFHEMLKSVSDSGTSFEDCQKILKKAIILDPGFKDFFVTHTMIPDWAKEANVPVVIVSSGMVPIIRSILENLLGEEDAARLDIVANEAKVAPDGTFEIVYRHPESGFGHDKSKALREYSQLPAGSRPTIFFCGDGVSDMSAAGESDLLFVKIVPGGSNDLSKYCDQRNVPYVPFQSFTEVKATVKDVVDGHATVEELNRVHRRS
ncbi:hypothetical protein EMMF5_002588 [Cystobasidiomycetes sp. EMM_F5]